MAISGHKGISRIDQDKRKTYGWYVRVNFNGVEHAKFFSDKSCGSREKALQEAVKYRDRIEKEIGKPRTDRTVVSRSPRNSSGIIGVRRKKREVKSENGEKKYKSYYEISWTPWPGRLNRTWVSIDEFGEKEALRRACAIRREKEREMYGSVIKANWASSLSKLLNN